jgi:hypothetical protein
LPPVGSAARYAVAMTEFEKIVAQAAVAADPALLGPKQTQKVIEKMRQIEASKVEQTLSDLVKQEVLVCTNTMPPMDREVGGFGTQGFGGAAFGGPPTFPPTFFKYEKGSKWQD